MIVYYSIRVVGSYIETVRQTVYNMALTTRNVFVIGPNLYSWFANISAYMILVVSAVYNLADDWLQFYNYVQDSLPKNLNLGQLIYYIDDIISAVRDPGYWIQNTIRFYLPSWWSILSDPVAFVIETILQRTGIPYEALFDLRNFINGLVTGLLGNLQEVIRNPQGWLLRELSYVSPYITQFLNDPFGFVQSLIRQQIPNLDQFTHDPESYIVDRLVSGLEKLLEHYQARLLKIFERILNAIF